MKKFRIIIAFALMLAMTVALNVTAFADNSQPSVATPTSYEGFYYFYDFDILDYIKVPFGTVVKMGSSGQEVKAVQIALFDISEYYNNINMHPGTIDSIFGDNTRRAVREYQALKCLSVDGEVGDNTYTKLEKDYGFLTGTYYEG